LIPNTFRVSIENLRIEVNTLSSKISKIKDQISKHQNDSSLHKEMDDFLISSEQEVKKLTQAIESQLNTIRIEMAEFLCEDLEHFKLEECFRIFSSFCQRFKLAVDENERRRENEMKLEARKSNSQLKRWPNTTNSSEAENLSPDNNSTSLNSTSINSMSNSMSSSFNGDQKLKRRSRRSSQDDELHAGLLEFLKTANDLGSNEIPIFGGTFRRMGSGRRSRTSNTLSDLELSSRERNKSIEKIGELDATVKINNRINGDILDNKNNNSNLSDPESDDESHKKKDSFNRFSPLRKTFSIKQTEAKRLNDFEAKQLNNYETKHLNNFETKHLNDLENNSNKSDPNNNHIEENNDKYKIDPTQLRQFWGAKQNESSNRPSTLHLTNHHSTHPTAVISPTKLVRSPQDQNNALLSPVLALESDLGNRSSRLPRRASITSPSSVTAAAIVAPLQVKITSIESSLPLKSKLPVRKNSLTRLPQQRKSGPNATKARAAPVQTGIPTPSRQTVTRQASARVTSGDVPQARTYRSPSTVSRTNLTSDMGSVSSMRRSSQLLPPSRSFMKQTSASAAKTRSQMRY